jgi:hypothetical protein
VHCGLLLLLLLLLILILLCFAQQPALLGHLHCLMRSSHCALSAVQQQLLHC